MNLLDKLTAEAQVQRQRGVSPSTSPLPTSDEAIAIRDQALEQVDGNSDDGWKVQALDAVKRTCEQLGEFISDDIWDTGGLDSTREDRALGPILLEARRRGWCRKTDRTRPSVRSHLSGKPVWRSLLHPSSPGAVNDRKERRV